MSQLRAARGFGTRAIKAATRVPRLEQEPALGAHLPVGHLPCRGCRATTPTSSASTGPATPTRASRTPPRPPWPRPSPSCTAQRPASPSARAWAPSTPPLLSLVSAGDRIVATRAVYGSTRALMERVLARARRGGRSTSTRSTSRPSRRALAAAPTRILYAETISNPTIVVADLARLAELAHRHGARLVVDNTFASPYLCQPARAGCRPRRRSRPPSGSAATPTSSPASWRADGSSSTRVRDVAIDTGGIVAPFSAFLVLRGMQTLHVRMDRHCQHGPRPGHVSSRPRPSVARRGLPGPAQPPPGGHRPAAAARRWRHARVRAGLARRRGRVHRRAQHPAGHGDARQRRDVRRPSTLGHASAAR